MKKIVPCTVCAPNTVQNLLCFSRIGYFIDEMEDNPKIPALFEIKMVLQEPDIVFQPSLNDDPTDKKSLIGLLNMLIKDMNAQALLVPRISIYCRDRTYMVRSATCVENPRRCTVYIVPYAVFDNVVGTYYVRFL